MPLILRSIKLTRLTIAEMDGNFTYLQDLTLGVSQSIADLHTILAGGTTNQVLAKASGSDYDLIWVDQTGGTGGATGSGSNGTNGTSGINGVRGATGATGSNGADGTNGTNGTSGVNGLDGSNGTSGVNGLDGSNGTSGVNGADGTNGTSGVNGADGTNGTNGTSGVNGANGTNGTSGVNGANGTNGTSGVNGADGTNGTNGTSGVNGADGTNGTSGVNGAVGQTVNILGVFTDYSSLTQSVGNVDTIPTPNDMDSYIVQDTSKVWIFSTASNAANLEGWVDMGVIAGAQGLTGETGTNGTSGTSGIDGTSGVNGVDGTNGEAGTNGTSGVNGEAGTNGTSGVNGLNGDAGTNGTSGNTTILNSINNIYSLVYESPSIWSAGNTQYWDRPRDGGGLPTDYLNINLLGEFGYATYSYTGLALADDTSYEVPYYQATGEFVSFLGTTYSSFWINSNSFITFGAQDFSGIIAPGGSGVDIPAIFIGAGDNSINKLTYGYDDPIVNTGTSSVGTEDLFRVRFEGGYDSDGSATPSTLKWELQITKSLSNTIKIIVENSLPSSSITFRDPGGVWGISDGVNWVEKFVGIPTYIEGIDFNLNAIEIYSIQTNDILYSEPIDSIKFIGPGVYKATNGASTVINIDPLNQYGIGVNYDASTGTAILSSTRYDLRLTTGKDGAAVRVRPRGVVEIKPYNRNSNQYGAGYGVIIQSSDAAPSPTQSDFNGGDITIKPGYGTIGGNTGIVNIGIGEFEASFQGALPSATFLYGTTFIDNSLTPGSGIYIYEPNLENYVQGWSGTYSTGDGRVAEVVSGLIVNVA